MPSNHLILGSPLSPSVLNLSQNEVFSNELARPIRWPKYWSFSFSISPSNEYSGLISSRVDWFHLAAKQDSLGILLLLYLYHCHGCWSVLGGSISSDPFPCLFCISNEVRQRSQSGRRSKHHLYNWKVGIGGCGSWTELQSDSPFLASTHPYLRGTHFCMIHHLEDGMNSLKLTWFSTWKREKSELPVPYLPIASHTNHSSCWWWGSGWEKGARKGVLQ